VLAITSGKSHSLSTPGARAEKAEIEKAQNKTGRNPLKSQETAKSEISLANDFNSLRGALRNVFISQAKFSLPFAKLSHLFRFACEIYQRVSEATTTAKTLGSG
jgi:hypothetical protein